MRYGFGLNKKVCSKICPYRLIFCPQVEEKKLMPSKFIEKIILITRIWSKSVFRFWPLKWMTNIVKSIFSWFWKQTKKSIKRVCYIHLPLPMGIIWAHLAKVYYPNSDFCFSVLFKQAWHYKSLFWIWPYQLIFHPQREENECSILLFL